MRKYSPQFPQGFEAEGGRARPWAVSLLGLVSVWTVTAATYNFYFNNTEQGDNSTATPSLAVEHQADGTDVVKKNGDVVNEEAKETSPAELPASASAAEGTHDQTPARPFRLSLAGGVEFYDDSAVLGPWGQGYYYNGSGDALYYQLSLAYMPLSYLGFQGFVAAGRKWSAGVELELDPVKLTLFGHEDVFELGLLAGASTMAAVDDNWVSLHVGARAALNFGKRWQLAANVRGNKGFLKTDLGLGYKF